MTQRKASTAGHSRQRVHFSSPLPAPKGSPPSRTLLRAAGDPSQGRPRRSPSSPGPGSNPSHKGWAAPGPGRWAPKCVACGPATSSQMTGPTMKPESTAFLLQIYSVWLPHQAGTEIFYFELLLNSLMQLAPSCKHKAQTQDAESRLLSASPPSLPSDQV